MVQTAEQLANDISDQARQLALGRIRSVRDFERMRLKKGNF